MDWNKIVPQLSPALRKLIAEELANKLVDGGMQIDPDAPPPPEPKKPRRPRTGELSKRLGKRVWDNKDGRPLATPKRMYIVRKDLQAHHGMIRKVHDHLKALKNDTVSYEGIQTIVHGIDPKATTGQGNLVIAHLYREGYLDVEPIK